MFNFIKNLVSGIMGFLSGLFGGKKSEDGKAIAGKQKKDRGFYLQMEDDDTTSVSEKLEAVKDAAVDKLESAKTATLDKLESAKTATLDKLESAKDVTLDKLEPVKAATTDKLESAKNAVDNKKEEKPEPVKASAPEKKSKPAKAVQDKKPEPVAANNGTSEAVPTEVGFASKYLMPKTNGRRRPGPSLDMFKDMARQVKTPS